MRKIIIITISSLVLISTGVLVYILFFVNGSNIVVSPQKTTQSVFPIATNSSKPTTTTSETTNNSTQTQNTKTIINTSSGELPRLVQISKGPVVPSILSLDSASTTTSTTTPQSISTLIEYIDQQSGNIYQYNSSTGVQTRTSNKTIPGIRSAAWLSDGSLAYVQYLTQTSGKNKNISTYALTKNGVGGFFLPQGLSEILARGNNTILAVSSSKNGSIVKEADKTSSNVSTAFQTPLSAIRVMFSGSKNYLVYTKPSATIGGYAFSVNGVTGIFTPIIGPLNGLVALVNHAGNNVLISYVNASGSMQMELVSIPTHTITKLPLSTIANKCVWSQNDSSIYCGIPKNPTNGEYPDIWYQGASSFTDKIWKIDITGNYAKFLFDFSKEESSPLDAIGLSVDSNQQFLSFVNKRTGALWSYRLQQ